MMVTEGIWSNATVCYYNAPVFGSGTNGAN